MSLDQHAPFRADADLVDVTEPHHWTPPHKLLDPEFRIYSGRFPVAVDPALREPEEAK